MVALTHGAKCCIFGLLIVLMFMYSIFFMIKTGRSVKPMLGSKKRFNYQFYMENLHKPKQPYEELIQYFNLTEFNKFIDQYCPVENLYISSKCLKELVNCQELSKPAIIDNEKRLLYYHTIWPELQTSAIYSIDSRIRQLNVNSYLSTQNLLHTKLIIWIIKPFQRNVIMYIKSMFINFFNKKIIEIKIVNFKELCSKSFVTNSYYNSCTSLSELGDVEENKFYAAKDFIKFLLLNSYGGIYVDYDFIYLEDLKPFWSMNFAYRWSHLDDFSFSVIGLKNNLENTINEFLRRLFSPSSGKSTNSFLQLFHPFSIRDIIVELNKGNLYNYKSFKIYHSALFDPSWLCHNHILDKNKNSFKVCHFIDIFEQGVKNFSINDFFKGAFLYHIHIDDIYIRENAIKNDSYFYNLEKYYKANLILK